MSDGFFNADKMSDRSFVYKWCENNPKSYNTRGKRLRYVGETNNGIGGTASNRREISKKVNFREGMRSINNVYIDTINCIE